MWNLLAADRDYNGTSPRKMLLQAANEFYISINAIILSSINS